MMKRKGEYMKKIIIEYASIIGIAFLIVVISAISEVLFKIKDDTINNFIIVLLAVFINDVFKNHNK